MIILPKNSTDIEISRLFISCKELSKENLKHLANNVVLSFNNPIYNSSSDTDDSVPKSILKKFKDYYFIPITLYSLYVKKVTRVKIDNLVVIRSFSLPDKVLLYPAYQETVVQSGHKEFEELELRDRLIKLTKYFSRDNPLSYPKFFLIKLIKYEFNNSE